MSNRLILNRRNLIAAATLLGCNAVLAGGAHRTQPPAAKAPEEQPSKSRAVVVFFSMPETDRAENMTDEEANSTHVADGRVWGNVEWLAELIARRTGADVIRLVPAEAYPRDHATLIAQAKREQDDNVRPQFSPATIKALAGLPAYDTIYLGSPVWWYTYPMILLRFLEDYDLAGKTVIPFAAHGGSGLADMAERIAALQPKANLGRGYSVHRSRIERAEHEIPIWLEEAGH